MCIRILGPTVSCTPQLLILSSHPLSSQRATTERLAAGLAPYTEESFEDFAQSVPQLSHRTDRFADNHSPVQLVARDSGFARGARSRGGMSAADAEAAAAAHRYALDTAPGASSRAAAYSEAAAFAPNTVASVAVAPEGLNGTMMPLMLDAIAATAPWAAIASGLAVMAAALSYSVRDAAYADSQRLRPAFGGAGAGSAAGYGAGSFDDESGSETNLEKIRIAADNLLKQVRFPAAQLLTAGTSSHVYTLWLAGTSVGCVLLFIARCRFS